MLDVKAVVTSLEKWSDSHMHRHLRAGALPHLHVHMSIEESLHGVTVTIEVRLCELAGSVHSIDFRMRLGR